MLPGCGEGKTEAKSAAAQGAQPAPSVVVAPVVQKTVPIFSELTARTDASDSVDIRARVKAFLVKQSYEEGKMVQAGQTLFTLDNREYEAQLMQAKAQLAKARGRPGAGARKDCRRHGASEPADRHGAVEQDRQDVKRLKPLAEQKRRAATGL